jgi:acyl carrier protein
MNFTQHEGLECLRTAILQDLTHLAVFRLNVEEFERSHAEDGIPPIFSVLANTGGTSVRVSTAEAAILDDLVRASSRNMRMDILEGYLQQQLSHVLKLAVDRIDRERTLGTMGLDSLMALEFIRRINAGLGLALPATAAFNYPSIRQLASHILQKLSLDAAGTSDFAPIAEAPAVPLASIYIEDVSEEEAIDALMKPDGAAYER